MKTIESLEDCVPDNSNANEGTLRGSQLMERSFENHGAGRSIVVDANGVVIAGNTSLEVAVERGLDALVVQSDGTKLIVVQRIDLDITDPFTRELAYLDNRTAQMGLKWDPARIEADIAKGVSLGSMFTEEERAQTLAKLDDGPTHVSVMFDTEAQRAQFLKLMTFIRETFAAPGQVNQWLVNRLTELEA